MKEQHSLFHSISRPDLYSKSMKKVLIILTLLSSASAASVGKLSVTDKTFLGKAVTSNLFEIQAAQLALTLSKTSADQTYARQMISDHTKVGAEVKAAVAKIDPGMVLPNTVSKAQQRMLDKLKKSGKKFDKLYKADMLSSHTRAVTLFTRYTTSRHASAAIKAVAMSALPTIKLHRDEAKTLPKM